MHFQCLSTAMAALFTASLVLAAPTADFSITGGAKFTVNQTNNPKYTGPEPLLAMAKTYIKYKKTVPQQLKNAILRKFPTWGSVPATPAQYDEYYMEPVQIGTPPQKLTLDFDTGSSDLWVFSIETPADEVEGQTLYNPNISTTAKNLPGYSWFIFYGDGSYSDGDVYTDKVCVGTACYFNQSVETAQDVSGEFTSETSNDGLLGLGFSNINQVYPTQQNTWFENILPSLASPLFTVNLKHNETGNYNFGFIDPFEYYGQIGYTEVDPSQGYWIFNSTGYGVGFNNYTKETITAIADTGTTLLYLPDEVCAEYYNQVPGGIFNYDYYGYTFPCNVTNLPAFTFGIGEGYRGYVPGEYFNYSPTGAGDGLCFGGLQSSDDIGLNIVGDILLKSQLVVFEGGNSPRIGFANKFDTW